MHIIKLDTIPETFFNVSKLPDALYIKALELGVLELIRQGLVECKEARVPEKNS